ncbi:aftiphilin-like isoform X4 [Sinocyclocheilus rhinocerous]|uniref:aftiphilin-like isoform X4 n=1 Tax=Sinocyclocheilus rhinocerous TaxID=307959 RepID=UPI0007BA3045|nr:PREDICTED: aftiphilin-like isoform X4 [Sinocyclocheilus rhinocerous]
MEPDVIRMYSSSPPPMEDGIEDEDDEFSDFTGVPNSTSFDTATTFDQSQALNATSPPELLSNGRIVGLSAQPAGSTKANGVTPGSGQTATPNGRTVSVEELKKFSEHQAHIASLEFATGSRTDSDAIDCNGTVEVLTNGFATLDQGGSPPTPHKTNEFDVSPDDFADFSAFSNAEHNQPSETDWEHSNQGCIPPQNDANDSVEERGSSLEDNSRDSRNTGFGFFSENSESLSNGDWGFHEGSDLDRRELEADTTGVVSLVQPLALNGVTFSETDENRVSPDSTGDKSSGKQSDEKGSENETLETETSFGRPLSTDALEEFGDFSTTGSVPSPPLQEETATPADHSQLAEDDDEDFGDFGDFGDASSFSATGFADFDQQGVSQPEPDPSPPVEVEDDEFGDFDTSKEPSKTDLAGEAATTFADFPGSDSFAEFSSVQVGDNEGWQAFSELDQSQNEGESWASFGREQNAAATEKNRDDWQESQPVTAPPTAAEEHKSCTMSALVSRLEKIFQASFELVVAPQVEEQVTTLNTFLKPPDTSQQEDADRGPANGFCRALRDVWQQLQDVNNAYGLRYQWGGSHTNKALLCSLGIDTRNILFTGHKKQPVIVPMYAASLGMLEPTKEPVKPVSAAEMIASIAQSPSVATELNTCPPDTAQESLPPVQFDWSSSGLTNPLDGVDPELYELTQAKLDVSGGSSGVVDAFARLMSTVEKTSTSTSRKPVQKEENLSEEARRVISGLPDLSFMQAKVLMFPSTLTPLLPSSSPSPTPD